MTPTYDLVPGEAVGRFKLGDSLWHVLEILRSHKVDYPKVELAWDPEDALTSAVTIHLPNLDLYFPPSLHQSLTLILVTSLSHLDLTYESKSLSSAGPSNVLTRAKVGKVLGPTYAGGSSSNLVYPGIEFDFTPTSTTGGGTAPVGGLGSGGGSKSNAIAPPTGGRDDVVHSIKVRPKDEDKEVFISPLVACEINPGKGVTLYVPDPIEIILGKTTAVDVRTDLGSSMGKYWKTDDRLAKMWGVGETVNLEEGYRFWNYFNYGLDFLLDPEGVVVKVILHSNIPGTPLFQRYARCPWILPSSSGDLTYNSPIASFRSSLSARAVASYVDEVKLSVPEKSTRSSSSGSTTSSKGSTNGRAEKFKGPQDGLKQQRKKGKAEVIDWKEDVMVLDRLSEVGYEGVNGVSPSRLHGFDGVIIEEDQASGGICSVLVWKDDTAVNPTALAE